MENIDNKVVFKSKIVSAEIVKEEKTTNVEKDTGGTEQESINRESDSSMSSGCVVGDVEEFTTIEPANGELRKVLVFTLNEKQLKSICKTLDIQFTTVEEIKEHLKTLEPLV